MQYKSLQRPWEIVLKMASWWLRKGKRERKNRKIEGPNVKGMTVGGLDAKQFPRRKRMSNPNIVSTKLIVW